MTAVSIPDLRAFLGGTWRIARRIHDYRLGIRGQMDGHAVFAPAPNGLSYDETGLMQFGDYRGDAAQRYLFLIDRQAAAEVCFADGRPFHRLDLSTGKADVVHVCSADRYRGRYRVLKEDCWSVLWRITGPRKDLSLVTRFSRTILGQPREWGGR